MKKLAFGAVAFAGLLVACSSSTNPGTKLMVMADAAVDASASAACSGLICCPLTPDNTGCATDQKCTWVIDQAGSNGNAALGHVDCVPCAGGNCAVAIGGACTQGPAGTTTGFDQCVAGAYCLPHDDGTGSNDGPGICKQICDTAAAAGSGLSCPSNGSGIQGNFACNGYSGIFGPVGSEVAGVCDSFCDPLADNKFGSNNTATGSDCDPGNGSNDEGEGCWGFQCAAGLGSGSDMCPIDGSRYTCNRAHNKTLVHRSACTNVPVGSDNPVACLNGAGQPFSNTCSPGFLPIVQDDDAGSMSFVCASFCQIADCYMGNCGGAGDPNLVGGAPHRCNSTDSSGIFNSPTPGSNATPINGDQCNAEWVSEVAQDGSGNLFIDGNAAGTKSFWSDTVGYCLDHSKYYYDSNGDMMVDNTDARLPECDTIPMPGFGTGSGTGTAGTAGYCTPANGCVEAANFGCTTPTAAGVSFQGKAKIAGRKVLMTTFRQPYHALNR